MKIKYHEEEKSIDIDDGLQTHNRIINFIMLANIFAAGSSLYKMSQVQFEWMGFIWIGLIVLSLGIIFYQIFKISSAQKIKLDQIEFLKEKSIFGRSRYSLKLTNGRFRNLKTLRKQSELDALKKFFSEIGVQMESV